MRSTHEPDWLTVLGLKDPKEFDWGEVRGAQIGAVRNVALARVMMSVLGATVIVGTLRTTAALPLLLVWFAVVIVVTGLQGFAQLRVKNEPIATATRKQLHRETLSLLLTALCWCGLPLIFSGSGDARQMLTVWSVMTGMMGLATFTLASIPLATAGFLLVMGGSLAFMMWSLDLTLIAISAMAYAVSLAAACLVSGRTFILHQHASLALKEKSEVVSLLLREYEDSGGDWMWQTDASRCLSHVSPRLGLALGVEIGALEAKPLLQILAGDAWEAGNFGATLRELAEHLKNRTSFSDLVVPVQIHGETRWWELSASPRVDEAGIFQGFRGVGSDVTEQHKSADKINRMARYDTLTGLPNRLQITEALGHAMLEADRWRGRCGFMMIDLDRFKAVNDTLGHPVGDRVLMRVSERLRSIMTDNEICGRLGGDEFAVVVKDASDAAKMARLARAIIDTVSVPYEIDHNTIYIGASVGSAVGPRDGRSVEMLIRSADLALYRSKDQGGGSFNVYEPQLHVHAEERRVLEIALRKALERNEFEIHYQPVVNAQSSDIESFEALLRWKNPDLGNVSPIKFIPIAEEARLIGPIGEWVLRTACLEAAKWPSTIRVAVNVSAEQLHDAHFVSAVVSALANAGLPPHRLELEVTESVFMREGTIAVAVLERILALGVRLALDDFGTGYSSLGYLSKTKFSTIKIDRSFVQGASKNLPESLAIIRAVVALANSLGMSTTAEGVETDEECKMISDLGCKKIQGYLFGRPMPASEASGLFTASQHRSAA
ncbi:MAG: putative bifunctional diguanylate cyclase/phosphodiesterase [Sphingomonadaceae bacterium]